MRQWRYFRMAVKGRKAEIYFRREQSLCFARAQNMPVKPMIRKLFQLLMMLGERLNTPAAHNSTSLSSPLFSLCSASFTALYVIWFCKKRQLGKN